MKKILLFCLTLLLIVSVTYSQESPGMDGFLASNLFKRIKSYADIQVSPSSFVKDEKNQYVTWEYNTAFPVNFRSISKTAPEGHVYGIIRRKSNDPRSFGDASVYYFFACKYDEKNKTWGLIEKGDPLILVGGKHLPYKGGKELYAYIDYLKYGEPIDIKISNNGYPNGYIIDATYRKNGETIKIRYETYFTFHIKDKKTDKDLYYVRLMTSEIEPDDYPNTNVKKRRY